MGTTLDASPSFDQDEAGMSIVSYEWDLDGDGGYGEATGAMLPLSWSTILANGGAPGGTYTVAVKVTDNEGTTDTEFHTINLGEPSDPVAGFYALNPVAEGEMVTFDGRTSYDTDEMGVSIALYE